MFYDRDEKEKGEDDISYNMNVGILVYNMGETGVVLPAGPVARGHPNGRRASQSHILAGPVGQP